MSSDPSPDPRLALLKSWLAEVMPDASSPEPASSDASFRRYFRVFSGAEDNLLAEAASFIVMDAPPAQEDCRPFVAVAQQLENAGVRAPRVLAEDLQRGFLLLDDLGHETLLSSLNAGNADAAYRRAISELLLIQQADVAGLPAYDMALLQREVALFHDWYLGVHKQRLLSAQEQQIWEQACQLLLERALQQSRVFVHRDYHSRNLMWAESGPFGVLDFQDAVHGPLTYDLVSLLRDCYVSWPQEQLDAWLQAYYQQAENLDISLPTFSQFRQDFDWMGVQRHLKAVGIFARLNHRDGKSNYLNDIPRTLTYLRDVSAQYPELDIIHRLAVESLGAE